jgi:hypothetical protein
MKFFPRRQQGTKGGANSGITSHPENRRLEGIKRMIRAGGVSKVFAPSLTAARERALHENQNNNNDILREE